MTLILHSGNKRGMIGKAVVLQSQKNGKTELMGVAVCGDMLVNFRLQYDWPTLNKKDFLEHLADTLAEQLEIPASEMDCRDRELLGLMEEKHNLLVGEGLAAMQANSLKLN